MTALTLPPGFLALCLLLWGALADALPQALALASALEVRHLTRRRLGLRGTDFVLVMDLCLLAIAAALALLFFTPRTRSLGALLLGWSPLLMAPLALAHAWSDAGAVPVSQLFHALPRLLPRLFHKILHGLLLGLLPSHVSRRVSKMRARARTRAEAQSAVTPGPSVDLSLAYAALCLLAAGGANAPGPWYFAGTTLCLGWLLLANRPTGSGQGLPWRFGLALAVALALAHGGQQALVKAQHHARSWQQQRMQDPYRSRTSIGDIQSPKGSRQVVLRVEPSATSQTESQSLGKVQDHGTNRDEAPAPLYLLHAAYDFFATATWQATEAPMDLLPPRNAATPPTSYDLPQFPVVPGRHDPGSGVVRVPGREIIRNLTVYQYFPAAKGLLARPLNAARVDDVPAERITGNNMGAVQVENVPGMVGYRLTLQDGMQGLRPPDRMDTIIAPLDLPAIEQTIEAVFPAVNATEYSPAQRIEVLKAWFASRFVYTLETARPAPATQQPGRSRPVEAFLLHHRRGHCEHFATAGTLLLRRLGLPARYATGYAAQEWDAESGMFVVRQNHAHAWTLVWLDGAWQVADFTPPGWLAQDDALRWPLQGALRSLGDHISAAFFAFSRWRWLSQTSGMRLGLTVLAVGLGIFLLLRIWKRSRQRERRHATSLAPVPPPPPGADSPFYAVLARLEAAAGPRPPGEPLAAWLRRLNQPTLLPLLELHYRCRFDPRGLPADASQRLDAETACWLELHRPDQ